MKCAEKKLSENQINDLNSHFSRDIVWWKIRLYEFLNPMTPCCVLLLFFNKLETMTQALLWWEKKDFTGCLQAKFEEGKIIGILGSDFIASNNANFQQLWQITVCSKSDNSTTYALFWSYAAEKILCCHICSKQKDFFHPMIRSADAVMFVTPWCTYIAKVLCCPKSCTLDAPINRRPPFRKVAWRSKHTLRSDRR